MEKWCVWIVSPGEWHSSPQSDRSKLELWWVTENIISLFADICSYYGFPCFFPYFLFANSDGVKLGFELLGSWWIWAKQFLTNDRWFMMVYLICSWIMYIVYIYIYMYCIYIYIWIICSFVHQFLMWSYSLMVHLPIYLWSSDMACWNQPPFTEDFQASHISLPKFCHVNPCFCWLNHVKPPFPLVKIIICVG